MTTGASGAYGGAVVGVPAHDKRDFEFAQVFNLPVIRVVMTESGEMGEITTIGDKFKYMEETVYKQSTQPLYVLLDGKEQILNHPRGYKSGIQEYINWLDEGINEFKKRGKEK